MVPDFEGQSTEWNGTVGVPFDIQYPGVDQPEPHYILLQRDDNEQGLKDNDERTKRQTVSGIFFFFYSHQDSTCIVDTSSTMQMQTTGLEPCYLLFGNRQFVVQMNRDGSNMLAFQLGSEANAIAVDFDYR